MTVDSLTCLSRGDPNKDIFNGMKKLQKKKRHNFYNMVEIRNGRLICQNESYSLDDVCRDNRKDRKCTLKNTNNEVVDLNYER